MKTISFALPVLVVLAASALAQKPELVVQTGHSREVVSITFSPDGKTLVSVGWDDTIKIWDVASGRELRSLPEHHNGFMRSAAFSPKADTLASVSGLNVLTIWNVNSGKAVSATRFPDSVDRVAFSPDGRLIALSTFSEVKLLDVATGKELRTLANASAPVAFSFDGQTLATGAGDRSIKLWDLASGREIQSLLGDLRGVLSIAFSRDGQLLAFGCHDQTVRLWDAVTGSERHVLLGHTGDVNAVVFSADAGTLVSGSRDKTLKFWDVGNGRELGTVAAHDDAIQNLALAPDGKLLASASDDHAIRLWNMDSRNLARTLSGRTDPLNAIAFSNDGKLLATGSGGKTIKLWNFSTGTMVRTFAGHRDVVWDVAFGPDGKTLASGSKDRTIVLWDVDTGRIKQTLNGHSDDVSSVAFNRDGTLLASASWDKTIKLWDVTSGRETQTLSGHSKRVVAVAFSLDEKMLASASEDLTIKLWDVTAGKLVQTLNGHTDVIRSIAFHKDGKRLASASWDNSIKLWDLATGRVTMSLSRSNRPASQTRTMTVADGSVQKQIGDLKSVGPGMVAPPLPNGIAFSADGKTLFSGNNDATITRWDLATGKELRTAPGRSEFVQQLALRPDGRILAAIGSDHSVQLWDAVSGAEVATLISVDQRDWVVTSDDGLFDGSPGGWSQLLWRFNQQTFDVAAVEIFFNEFFYPGLLSELSEGKRPRAQQSIIAKDRRQPRLTLTLSDEATARAAAAAQPSSGPRPVTSDELAAIWRKVQPGGRGFATVNIKVTDAAAGAQDLRLFRNGSLVKRWRGDILAGKSSAEFYATIPVPGGANQLTAYAFNKDNIKSSDATLTVSKPETNQKGTAYILAIGVNEYANSEYNLKYAVADAQAFGEEMKMRQTALNNFARIQLTTLTDKEATKTKILASLSSLALKAQPEDTLLVFFAGHGTAQDNRFFLIPHDLGYTGARDPLSAAGLQAILSHSISDQELEEAVEPIGAGRMLLIIDACNSGQALEAEEKRRGPMNSKGLAQLAYEKGMYILTAAQSYQAALEAARLGHGYLTSALVDEGLKTGAADNQPKDGQVLLREWLDFATERVPQMQQQELDDQKKQGRQLERIKFAETDSGNERSLQRPRVFYRRELEPQPLVVARP